MCMGFVTCVSVCKWYTVHVLCIYCVHISVYIYDQEYMCMCGLMCTVRAYVTLTELHGTSE